MMTQVTNKEVVKAVCHSEVFRVEPQLDSISDEVALTAARNNRLREFFARMFLSFNQDGRVVTKIVISPYVNYIIRACNNNREGIPFYESTKRVFCQTGLVYGLWTAEMYMAKECDGVTLFSLEDDDKIEEMFPSIKEKWDACRKKMDEPK